VSFWPSIGLAAWALRASVRGARRPQIWLPFLLLTLIQLGVLVLLLNFYRPPFLAAMLPIVRVLGGEDATHYPHFYLTLPILSTRIAVVLTVVVASVVAGIGTLLFAREFGVEIPGSATKRVLRIAPRLMVLNLVAMAVLFGVLQLSRLIPAELVVANRGLRWLVRGGVLLVAIGVQSLFAYSIPWAVLQGHRVLAALRDSVRVTSSTLFPTLWLMAIPTLAVFPLDYLARRSDWFAAKLVPETVTGLILARIGLELLFMVFIGGAVTRLFVWRMEPAR
jgi:hypothetical protein